MNRIRTYVCIIAALGASLSAWAAPDDLDPTFGTGGKRVVGATEDVWATALLALPDGRFLTQDVYGQHLWRFNADGTPDLTFGGGTGEVLITSLCPGCFLRGIALDSSGRILLGGDSGTIRLLPDGSLDSSFGRAGRAYVFVPDGSFSVTGLVVQPDGTIIIAGSLQHSTPAPALPRSAALIRLLPTGAPDPAFGSSGVLVLPVNAQVFAFARTADGKLLIAGRQFPSFIPPTPDIRTVVARLMPDGQLDTGFANGGVFRDESSGAVAAHALALQPDGKLVIAGAARVGTHEQVALLRLDSAGRRDAGFGTDGQVVVTVEAGAEGSARSVAIDSRQRIVAVGGFAELTQLPYPAGPRMQRIVVARLNADGSPDGFFAPQGVTTLWSGYGSTAFEVAIQDENAILVGGAIEETPFYAGAGGHWIRKSRPALFRLKGGEGTVHRMIPEAIVVEYYHAVFGHYFISTTPNEIAKLDTATSLGWIRTGRSFKVWSGDDPSLSRVCRFFSHGSFAPKSSHFYTPYVDECAALRADSVWGLESNVFHLRLPSGAIGARDCPAGTAPLYRAYNNGMGGAPNHRYTVDASVLDEMLAKGWTFEGEAQTRVFACIPQRS